MLNGQWMLNYSEENLVNQLFKDILKNFKTHLELDSQFPNLDHYT